MKAILSMIHQTSLYRAPIFADWELGWQTLYKTLSVLSELADSAQFSSVQQKIQYHVNSSESDL